jgi:hypothetical protein
MRTVAGVAIALAVAAGVMLPGAPASATIISWNCVTQPLTPQAPVNEHQRCVSVDRAANGKLRALGSLEDLNGSGTVAVIVYLQRWDPAGWTIIEVSPRVEANNYVLAATEWHTCVSALHRAQVNWNYRDGRRTGTTYSPSVRVDC